MTPHDAHMTLEASRGGDSVSWRWLAEWLGGRRREGRGSPRHPGQQPHQHWARRLAPRALVGAALLLAGGVAGLAAGQSMANRAAHRKGACIALDMAGALGYLDAEQRRRVGHVLSTALNPEVDLFAGQPSVKEACSAGG